MITTILGIIGSPIIGSALGFFSSWVMKREERKNLQMKFTQDLEMKKLNHKQLIEGKRVEGELIVQKEEAEAFTATVESEGRLSGNKFLDGVKALIRPLITVYLLTAISYIAFKVSAIVGGFTVLPVEDLVTLYKEIIYQILFLTSMAVSFYFGNRLPQRK